ncbi:MAG: OmpA family protein [Flavobacteriales bacterium]|nr:OmpA family protein [Flavobacteriales bacterium]
MKYFSIIIIAFSTFVSFGQGDGSEELKKKNQESIELLKQRISSLEQEIGTTEEPTPTSVETQTILVLKDSIKLLEKELATCANSQKGPEEATIAVTKTTKDLTIYFARDVYKLSVEDKNNLDQLITSLPTTYNFIIIRGHADQVGDEQINELISKKRAESIRAYLLQTKKISPQKIVINWCGSEVPGSDTSTTEDDRRCELIVI